MNNKKSKHFKKKPQVKRMISKKRYVDPKENRINVKSFTHVARTQDKTHKPVKSLNKKIRDAKRLLEHAK